MGAAFEAIVGAEHVERPAAARLAGARVEAVVRPADAAELAACLRAASEARLAVVACGHGTRQHLGNPLDSEECVRLELGRLAAHLEVNPEEGVASADAGVRIGELRARLDACGKTSLLTDLPPQGSVGGALAADPFGADWTLDRRLANELLGVEVALANGELAAAGGRVVKNVTGFDLVRLYCGSLGTLAVLARVTFRLRAQPECERVIAARFASLEAGLAAFASAQGAADPAGAAIVPEQGGVELVFRLLGDERAIEDQAAQQPGDGAGPERWARVRAALATPPAPGLARVRLGARRSDVAELCRVAADSAGAGAVRGAYPLAGSVVLEVPDASLPQLSAAAERAGALFAAERAPDAGPSPCDVFGAPPDALALMRAVKTRFDPQRVLAPGRFVGRI